MFSFALTLFENITHTTCAKYYCFHLAGKGTENDKFKEESSNIWTLAINFTDEETDINFFVVLLLKPYN